MICITEEQYNQEYPPGSEKRRDFESRIRPRDIPVYLFPGDMGLPPQYLTPGTLNLEREPQMMQWCEIDEEGHGFNGKKGYVTLSIEVHKPEGSKVEAEDHEKVLCWKHALEQGYAPKEGKAIEGGTSA